MDQLRHPSLPAQQSQLTLGSPRLALSPHPASRHGPAHWHVVRALSLGPDRHLPRPHGVHHLDRHLVRFSPLSRRHSHVRQARHPARTPPLAPLQLRSPIVRSRKGNGCPTLRVFLAKGGTAQPSTTHELAN